MKIAFCGDSFCADVGMTFWGDTVGHKTKVQYPTWPFLIAKEFSGTIMCRGIPGNALFHAYERLLPVVNQTDYVMFCITDPHRIANKHGLPLTVGNTKYLLDLVSCGKADWVANEYCVTNKIVEKTLRAGDAYYTDIMSYEFHEMAHKGILMQIDKLMLETRKKCIWFCCFDSSMQGYIPKSGPTINTNLSDISNSELKHLSQTEQDKIHTSDDARANHFSEENNKNMANLVIDVIKNDNFNPREIKMEDYFEVVK